jgi:hypothetical protein
MKNKLKILILLFIMTSNVSLAQVLNFNELKDLKNTKREFTTYIGKDGGVYKVGERVVLGQPAGMIDGTKSFNYVTEGMLFLTAVNSLAAGETPEIKSLHIIGNKRGGYYVMARAKGFLGVQPYSIDIENAIAAGELISNGMSSDQALSELKKAKDKLDLGLITQEQYDAIKAELSKIIK